jgi:hypothetical protein
MIEIRVSVTDGASPMLRRAISAMTGADSSAINEQGGREAVTAAIAYHREFDQAGGWKGKRYLGPSTDGSSYGSEVTQAWSFQSADQRGATITNDARHLKFKSTGGTVVPKRTKFLTIPLIAEARGRRAADYEIFARTNLFLIKGKRALFERVGGEVTGKRGKGKSAAGASTIKSNTIRAVYALVRSVTHKPWPGALPPNNLLSDAFMDRYRRSLLEILQS